MILHKAYKEQEQLIGRVRVTTDEDGNIVEGAMIGATDNDGRIVEGGITGLTDDDTEDECQW